MVLEKTLESSLNCKEIQLVHPKGNQSWIFSGRTDAEAETLILWPPDLKNWLIWKEPWCWERLRAGGEGDDRGWDGWMASLTHWTWVWVNSGSWWWTGRSGMLRFMGLQIVGHDWATELNWTELIHWKDWCRSWNSSTLATWWLTGKDPDAGKHWGQEEKGMTEDEIVGWHHQLTGHEFEQALGDGKDRESWHASVHVVAKSWTRLNDQHQQQQN